MLKTSFSKYLIAFTIIIFVSFAMLSGIITSIIGNHLTEEKQNDLERAADVIANQFQDQGWSDLRSFIKTGPAEMIVMSVLNFNQDFDILITDTTGVVVLSTLIREDDGSPATYSELGKVNYNDFFVEKNEAEHLLFYNGMLNGLLNEHSIAIASPIIYESNKTGYVVAISSTATEDKLLTASRQAVFTSSIWVMLAAVIATYFITERIIHPLRVMKGAAKSFAKGDFSTRITVYGKDEVAELSSAFNNMAESLENLEKMRNSFLANISHDLRTPMTTISGFIDGITSGAIPPEKHEYYLGIISAEVHRLSRLVSQILDVSRLESGDRKFNFTDFDIAEVSRIVLISFEQKIESKSLDVHFEAENDSMYVYADKDAIYQVIYNLCHNALKFSNEGGKYIIKLFVDENDKIVFSIYDEGQIIPDNEIDMVFDRFYKIDKSRGLDKNGVGLGLYISKTIIEAHGEKIAAVSDSLGTEFRFTMKPSDTFSHLKE